MSLSPARRGARVPRLLAITAPDAPLDHRFEIWLDDLARAGVDAVQIRRKELGDRALLELALRACAVLAGTTVALLVNGRPDVAIAASGADGGSVGVHLPADGLPSQDVRGLLAARAALAGGRALVGRSTHRLDEIRRELRLGSDGPDYVTFGPAYATPGKPVRGLEGAGGLRAACAVGPPVLALGGVTAGRVAELARSGAAGVAAIRACADPSSAAELAAAARDAFPRPPAAPERP